ncbi:MAG: hypothetical protein QMC89_04355 [Candidatus Hodarchaeaceae archaeon]|nr:hypothetical protein [Candidatus Hodarchaeaceae archaeon]
MLTREEALNLLREAGCSRRVVEHCSAVAKKAIEIARQIRANGYEVDLS